MEERYFAASNSGKGFVSYFGDVFNISRLEHLYIIKGGPGTGKNVFMRSIASAAEKRNMKVVYYYCSSDQNSLDGIVIDNRIAVLDGTAPHDTDASLPGAADDIVDLGVFWSIEKLSSKRECIEELGREKKKHYRRAYRFLAAYQNISEASDKLTEPIIDRKKLEKEITILLKDIKNGSAYLPHIALCDSVGMDGRIRFDSFEKRAEKIYRIADSFGTAHYFLSSVANFAMLKDLEVTLSYDPIDSDKLDAVFLEESKVIFCVGSCRDRDEKTKNIPMSRFLPREELSCVRPALNSGAKLCSLVMDEALLALSEVKKAHFEIEKIYKDAMDFDAKEKFTAEFISKLFG
ncbi:MAG: hypothetical protein E7671_01915 [Ruminococcaceae bacterium]|nr:hypothetical protein [Oscillospiraceae bacterium]